MRSRIIGLFAAVMFAVGAATPVAAGESTVTFRLTIRGAPVPTDSFTLAVNPNNELIVDPGVRCGPGSDLYNEANVPCEAQSFDFDVSMPAGTELRYSYARYVDFLAAGGFSVEQVLLEGSITVADHPQTVTLVYDYGLGTSTGGPPQLLPDTRSGMPASMSWLWLPAAAVALMTLPIGYARRRAPVIRR